MSFDIAIDQATGNEYLGGWIRSVEAEYRDFPGLSLTKPQVRRLWGLDAETCDQVLHTLEDRHFLKHTNRDTYVLFPDAEGAAHVIGRRR